MKKVGNKDECLAQPWMDEMHKAKQEMSALVEKWIARLRLGDWSIETLWHFDRQDGHEDSWGWCHAEWRYMRASIHFSLPAIVENAKTTRDKEMVIVHELMHVVIAEMREWEHPKHASAHEERVTSHLTAIMLSAASAVK